MKNIIIREKSKGYRNEIYYSFYVLNMDDGRIGILYSYNSISEDYCKDGVPKEKIYPSRRGYTKASTCDEMLKAVKKSSYRNNNDYELINKEPEECNLIIPDSFYGADEVKIVETKDEIITDSILEKIKKRCRTEFTVILGEDLKGAKENDDKSAIRLYCSRCNKIHVGCKGSYYQGYCCPECNSFSGFGVIMKDYKDFQKKAYGGGRYSDEFYGTAYSQKEKFNILTTHPDDENGIILYCMYKEISANKGVVKVHYGVEYSIEHIVGKKICCNKHLKKGMKPCDAFEALNINTKNIGYPCSIIYDGADNFFDFAAKNEKFLRMSGFQTVLKYSTYRLNLEGFFVLFLCILNKYPVMEQIVKMGHSKIFFMLYGSMLESLNKDEINQKVERIAQLVDNEASKGKDALRFPMYIGDYLIKKGAELDEYYYWRDVYEITHITKEQFENLIDSINYAYINSQSTISDIGNILKFNYSVDKLLNYIVKYSMKSNFSISTTIQYLSDYLNMCDICQIEPDKYPQDLRKVHDDMIAFYRKREQATYDKRLNEIGTECENYIIPSEDELDKIGIPKLFSELTVVFPKSEEDFINEGNQQHNCVGSYPNSVRRGNCVIFFIRHRNEPNKSFITAECTARGLGQCYYSNNRYVSSDELRKFASYICTKINSGVKSGKIHALGNISN